MARASRSTALLVAVAAFWSLGAARPASYAQFDTSVAPSDGAALKAAIEGGQKQFIYVRSGYYTLDNPVVIDRTTSLFLHGQDRMYAVLAAKDPTQPLFVIRNAPLVNLAGLRIYPIRNVLSTLDSVAIVTQNTQPIAFEMFDCAVQAARLAFQGPGTYQIQSTVLSPGGRVRASIQVDHPGADVFVFGGDGSNAKETLKVNDFSFIWQLRGRLRVYATTFEAGLGPADIRIQSGSTLGPHVIANVRSEGVNGALSRSGAVSRLLYVPTTSSAVDVVLKSNGGAWDTGPLNDRMNCKLVSYYGAGTLWLLGNRAEGYCGLSLAEGNAPQATIVSAGNLISSPGAFPITVGTLISAEDLFNNIRWSGGTSGNPQVRWIPNGVAGPKLSSYASVPVPPEDAVPAALTRPTVSAALPGMLDVRSFGARGDGTSDDTSAIQGALDANCDGQTPKTLYFPAGTYRISRTLYLNHHLGANCHEAYPYGGWIAGAGSAKTIIAMAPGLKQGVFASDGLAWATMQGITFRTSPYASGDPPALNVDIEAYPGYLPSQLDNFYDVVFDGGFAGFATGAVYPTAGNCSGNAVFGSVIKNTHIGLVSGHFNALSNGVYQSQLVDNDYALGAWTNDRTNMPPGGTFYGYNSDSTGTRTQDFLFEGSASGSTWYFHDWTSDAPLYFVSAITSASWPLMFDRSSLNARPGQTYLFDVSSAMGPFFLWSYVTRAGIRLGQTPFAQRYAIRVGSSILDWSSAVALDANGVLDTLNPPGSAVPPAAPTIYPGP